MSFSDIFKKSFLEGYAASEIATFEVIICLGITAIIAFYIFIAYSLLTRKSFYDKNFGVSLVITSLITSAIVLTIQSSIVVSLGMVGALSIVRFRNAVKSPIDLAYLFWAISIGIICGAGLAQIAVILSLVVTISFVVLDILPVAKAPMLLVINANEYGSGEKILGVVKKYSKYNKVKSRNLSKDRLDMLIEVRVQNEDECVRELMTLEGVVSASLLNHDGEVTF